MPKTLTDQLKEAINRCSQSVYRIAKETGIPQPVVHRYNAVDHPTIRLDTAEKRAAYFGMHLTAPTKLKT